MKTIDQLTEAEEMERGKLLAKVLKLRAVGNGEPPYYRTEWGSKTALGLFRTVARIVLDGE